MEGFAFGGVAQRVAGYSREKPSNVNISRLQFIRVFPRETFSDFLLWDVVERRAYAWISDLEAKWGQGLEFCLMLCLHLGLDPLCSITSKEWFSSWLREGWSHAVRSGQRDAWHCPFSLNPLVLSSLGPPRENHQMLLLPETSWVLRCELASAPGPAPAAPALCLLRSVQLITTSSDHCFRKFNWPLSALTPFMLSLPLWVDVFLMSFLSL